LDEGDAVAEGFELADVVAQSAGYRARAKGSCPLWILIGEPILGHESSEARYVSALTCCTTMTTGLFGLSVTVYQMVRPSDGRWRR
jgi:hypothetical protein